STIAASDVPRESPVAAPRFGARPARTLPSLSVSACHDPCVLPRVTGSGPDTRVPGAGIPLAPLAAPMAIARDDVPLWPDEPAHLVELLARRAALAPDTVGYRFLADGDSEEATLTYGRLERSARDIAATIRELVEPGARALLLYPPGLEYVAGFLGCL